MWWCKSRANTHQPRQPCHDSTCHHNGTRSSNFQRHAPFAGRCRGVRRKTFARKQWSSPHLAPRTTVLCARGAGRALVMGRNHAAVDRDEGSSVGRSGHQTRHRWCPAIRIGHEQWPISRKMATYNGPFRSMGQRNGPFPENGLEQWPISRRWQTGVAHVAQSARRLRQARRQQEPQPGSAMTCCAPRTYPLHPEATVVAIDYRPEVVGATSLQRQPWTRCPGWAKDGRSA